jgi:uncharacterized protein YbaP (TraB family)
VLIVEGSLKNQIWLLGFLLLGACAHKIERPFIYEIEKQNVKSYVFGTIHMGISKKQLPSSVIQKFNQTPVVVVENRIDDTEDGMKDFFKKLGQDMLVRSQRKKLNEVLDEGTYQNVKKVMLKFIPDEGYIQFLTPKAAFYNLQILDSKMISLRKTTWDPAKSLDIEIYKDSVKLQKQIFELYTDETFKDKVCEDLVFTELIKRHFTISENTFIKELSDTKKYYFSGDEAEIQNISKDDNPAIQKCLITDRNLIFANRITEVQDLIKAPIFVSLGINHLVGESGLLKQLERQGFKVRRLENQNQQH